MNTAAMLARIQTLIGDEHATRYVSPYTAIFDTIASATRVVFNELISSGVYPTRLEQTVTLTAATSSGVLQSGTTSLDCVHIIVAREVTNGEWRDVEPIDILDEVSALASAKEALYLVRRLVELTVTVDTSEDTILFINRKLTTDKLFRVSFCRVPLWVETDPISGYEDKSIPAMMDDPVTMYAAAMLMLPDGNAYQEYMKVYQQQLQAVISSSKLSTQREVVDVYDSSPYPVAKRYG